FFCRMANEQLPLQGALFNDVARTNSLLVETASELGSAVVNEAFWRAALGCSTQEMFAVSLMLHASAIANQGSFDPGWLSQPNFEPIFQVIPKEVLLKVYEQHFCATPEELRALAGLDSPNGNLGRYGFNPLRVRPATRVPKGPHMVS